MLKVGIIGLGFVGLTTALGLAKKGHSVVGYDMDTHKSALLQQGEIPFHEPHLQEELQALTGKQFFLATHIAEAVKNADIVVFCVGTPNHPDGSVDVSHVHTAIVQCLPHIAEDKFCSFCIKSTLPPSTCAEQLLPLLSGKEDFIGLSNNPEFLREGYAWQDFMQPDRIVVGVVEEKSELLLDQLYQSFDAPMHKVSINEAEFIKYLSNTLLATMISFSNEMSMVAHRVGDIDIHKTFLVLHQDKRWFGEPANMTSYVYPGCGFGGYCLPKDLQSFINLAHAKGVKTSLLSAVKNVNESIAEFWVKKITSELAAQKKIAWLGLSFKPNSSDTRKTPVIPILSKLIAAGYHNITAYDPLAMTEFRDYNPDIDVQYAESMEACLKDADVVVVATAWKEFIDHREQLQQYRVFDLRYCL